MQCWQAAHSLEWGHDTGRQIGLGPLNFIYVFLLTNLSTTRFLLLLLHILMDKQDHRESVMLSAWSLSNPRGL